MLQTNHTFAICAYKESEYLEECICSLISQTVKTNIILVTSTPNEFIEDLCEKYHLPMYINKGETGITQDWNYAISCTKTNYVTIAHQDDVYEPEYVENLLQSIKTVKKPILFFTDYMELRDGRKVYNNKLLTIKRCMLLPLRVKAFWSSIFIRRRILSLGTPICCPSVTFVKENCPDVIFENGFKADEDWEAWEKLSKLSGAFIYCQKPLTLHRIHSDSETSKILQDNARTKEDYIMFCKFWPKPIAKILTKLYGTSENSNKL